MQIYNKLTGFIVLLLLAVLVVNIPCQTLASESLLNEPDREVVNMNIFQSKDNLTEGMLEIPEDVQREIILYQWIMEAVEQYISETGIEDVFSCDLENDLLYGDREFRLMEMQRAEWNRYVYPIKDETRIDMKRESYKLILPGVEHILYMDVNIKAGQIFIYPKEYGVAMQTKGGNITAYELIERDDNGQIEYYPDIYVESDWDDLAYSDNHFAEVSFDELGELNFMEIPDAIDDPVKYLNVASVLKRYVDEKQLDDVFYFDAEQDTISQVTNLIYTCRLRGTTMTLYIDIDGYNMKAHIYQVEE